MKKGFLFDSDLCVNCKACVAACSLENGYQAGTRAVYVYNSAALPVLSVTNLSLACNHCADPLCLSCCPAKAYSLYEEGGLVIHDPVKCMGCGFCTWRCPFNAPKMNIRKGHIEKCNYCLDRTGKGIEPACTAACPTGALKFTESEVFTNASPLIPGTDITPSLTINGRGPDARPQIFPSDAGEDVMEKSSSRESTSGEWSLILFSFLVTVAASLSATEYTGGITAGYITITALMAGTLVISFTHLGKPIRSWRALLNINSSPLSREIAAVSLFTAASAVNIFFSSLSLQIITVLLGAYALTDIDALYYSTGKSKSLMWHSGQTFFSALLFFSVAAGWTKTFALLTVLAAASAVFRKRTGSSRQYELMLYTRMVLLIVPLALILLHMNFSNPVFAIITLCGIFTDRVLFYNDFKPLNISRHIEDITISDYEKNRSEKPKDSYLS